MNDVVVSWLFAGSSSRWPPCAVFMIEIRNRNRKTVSSCDTHEHDNACMKMTELTDGITLENGETVLKMLMAR